MLRYLFCPRDALSTERLLGDSRKLVLKPRMPMGKFLDSRPPSRELILPGYEALPLGPNLRLVVPS